MARFQYNPPDEPLRVTIRITIFLVGMLVLLAGSIVETIAGAGSWGERLVVSGACLVIVAFFMTALDNN